MTSTNRSLFFGKNQMRGACGQLVNALVMLSYLTANVNLMAASETGNVGKDQIRRIWLSRQEKVTGVLVNWTETHVASSETFSEPPGTINREDGVFQFTVDLGIHKDQIRYEAPQQMRWDVEAKKLVPNAFISSFDGKENRDLTSSRDAPAQGRIRNDTKTYGARIAAVRPMLWSFRPLDVTMGGFDLTDFAFDDGVTEVADSKCQTISDGRARLYLDANRGYVIRKAVIHSPNGKPQIVFEVSYSQSELCEWMPASWQITMYDRQGKVIGNEWAEVNNLQINPTIGEEYFRTEFPVGTVVYDERENDPNKRQYVVQSPSVNRPILLSELGRKSFQDLMTSQPEDYPRRRISILLWCFLIANAIAISMFLGYCLHRKSRRRN